MIVAVNANAANPHYMPTKDKNSPIKRGDFVLIDAATKLQTGRSRDRSNLDWLRRRICAGRVLTHFQHCARSPRFGVDFVRKNIRAGKSIRGAEVDDVSRGVITRAGFGEQFTHRTGHSIGEETTAMASTSTISRRAIRGVSFPEFVFPSSREFTSKENLAFDRKSTFTFRTKTSKSPAANSNGDYSDPKTR
jgi:Xaa-Pro aminopeptidase